MATIAVSRDRAPDLLSGLNTIWHYRALSFYLIVVAAHWLEHGTQAIQIYVLGRTPPEALGLLGSAFPSLVSSEALHYGYALFMFAGLLLLRSGFTGSARKWWTAALLIQVWHHLEHLLLLGQAVLGTNLLDKPKPVSIVQLVLPRVELHLLYNMLVLVPLLVAIGLHWFPRPGEGDDRRCSCAKRAPA